jgi:hypothetical protein
MENLAGHWRGAIARLETEESNFMRTIEHRVLVLRCLHRLNSAYELEALALRWGRGVATHILEVGHRPQPGEPQVPITYSGFKDWF